MISNFYAYGKRIIEHRDNYRNVHCNNEQYITIYGYKSLSTFSYRNRNGSFVQKYSNDTLFNLGSKHTFFNFNYEYFIYPNIEKKLDEYINIQGLTIDFYNYPNNPCISINYLINGIIIFSAIPYTFANTIRNAQKRRRKKRSEDIYTNTLLLLPELWNIILNYF